MWVKVFIVLLHIAYFILAIHNKLMWPYKVFFGYITNIFVAARNRNTKDMNWIRNKVYELKKKNA